MYLILQMTKQSFFKNKFIYLFNFCLHWVFTAARELSLVAANRRFLAVRGLLIAVASLVAEHEL